MNIKASILLINVVFMSITFLNGKEQIFGRLYLNSSPNYNVCLSLDMRTGRLAHYLKFDQPDFGTFTAIGVESFADFTYRLKGAVNDFLNSNIYNSKNIDANNDWRVLQVESPKNNGHRKKRPQPLTWNDHFVMPVNEFILFKSQIFGGERYIWELKFWDELGKKIQKYKKPFIISHEFNSFLPIKDVSLLKNTPSLTFSKHIVIDKERYEILDKLRIKAEKEGIKYAPAHNERHYFRERLTDIDDGYCSANILFDENSGRILTYMLYTGNEPVNIDLEPLYRLVCEPDFIIKAMSLKYFQNRNDDERINFVSFIDKAKTPGLIIYPDSFDFGNNDSRIKKARGYIHVTSTEQEPVYNRFVDPTRKLLQEKNLMTIYPGNIFGGECFIWELKIWQALGEQIKINKCPYILFTYATAMNGDLGSSSLNEKELPPDKTLIIDQKLYDKMETLRQQHITAIKKITEQE